MSEDMQSPVFVGRRDEIASLVALLDRARAGEPGPSAAAVASRTPSRYRR
jgi:hypothetical protein